MHRFANPFHHRHIARFVALFLLLTASAAGQVSLEMTPVSRAGVWARLALTPQSNEERATRLFNLLESAGCPELIKEEVGRSKLPNIVCTLPGVSDDLILVGAHYDKTEAGQGALDNWSGASLLVSLLEALADKKRQHTFRFVGFTDEEKGLIGSRSHARRYSKKDPKAPQAAINMDTIGGATASVWRKRADDRLVGGLQNVATAMKLPLQFVNIDQVGSTDSESFRKRGIPVITIHSVTQDTFPALHTEDDTLKLVDRSHHYDSYRLVLAYLIFLDQVWPPEEAVESERSGR